MTAHMTRGEAEAMAARVRMALAEAGHPDARVGVAEIEFDWGPMSGWTPVVFCKTMDDPVCEPFYRAFQISLPPEIAHVIPCFECYKDDPWATRGIGRACMAGDCRHGN